MTIRIYNKKTKQISEYTQVYSINFTYQKDNGINGSYWLTLSGSKIREYDSTTGEWKKLSNTLKNGHKQYDWPIGIDPKYDEYIIMKFDIEF